MSADFVCTDKQRRTMKTILDHIDRAGDFIRLQDLAAGDPASYHAMYSTLRFLKKHGMVETERRGMYVYVKPTTKAYVYFKPVPVTAL